MEVGDLLVSVDNIVAETPRLLAQGLMDSGLSQSGKLVVVKVSMGRRGQWGRNRWRFMAIDILDVVAFRNKHNEGMYTILASLFFSAGRDSCCGSTRTR